VALAGSDTPHSILLIKQSSEKAELGDREFPQPEKRVGDV